MKRLSLIAAAALAGFASVNSTLYAQADVQAVASPAQGQAPAAPPGQRAVNVPQLRQLANQTYADENWPVFLEVAKGLHQLRPWNVDYMSLLVLAHARNNDRAAAYEMMLTMQRQGLSHDFTATDDTESLRGTEAFDYINDLMVRAGEPAGAAEQQFTLPPELRLGTAMDWDSTRNGFLIGEVTAGAVWFANEQGTAKQLLAADEENGLWAIHGLAVDEENNRLWLSSSATRQFSGFEQTDAGRAAVLEFTLDELELVKKYPVPADGRPHQLGDLVLVPNGDLYAIDSVLPIIYKLEKGGDRLERFVASMDNVFLRSIAASDDGRFLYFADYELGITVLDLEDRKAVRLTGPETLNFGGIEGMEYWDGHLVVVQSGIRPERLMRLKLSADGGSIEEVAPLAIAQPFFDHPSVGVVQDGKFWFFANSYSAQNPTQPEPIRVATTSLADAPDLVSPDVEKFWDDYYEKTGQERPDAPSN